MSVNVLRLHGPIANSPSATNKLEAIQAMRKTRKSDSELIQCVETWLHDSRLCPKKSDIMSSMFEGERFAKGLSETAPSRSKRVLCLS